MNHLNQIIQRLAQAGRYGEGIATEDLERIYEWTYKLQMLEREETLGDYGVPQTLPDRAYMEKAKIVPALEQKLDEVYETMTGIYDAWIIGHEPDINDYVDSAWENWGETKYEFAHGYIKLQDLGDRLGEDNFKNTIVEFLKERLEEGAEEEEDEEDEFGERMEYLDRMKTSQQKNLPHMGLPPEDPDPEPEEIKPLEEMDLEELGMFAAFEENIDAILEEVEREAYFDMYIIESAKEDMEYDMEYGENPYNDVVNMREDLNGWEDLSPSDKIIKFQEALTIAHNNGEMAEYLLNDADAVEILDRLSAGESVAEWDKELSQMLGYQLGSRLTAPSQEWFVPAFIRRLAHVIKILRQRYDPTF